MEVIGEIKYMRDLVSAFIENKSNDGNWFSKQNRVNTSYSVF